MAQLSNTKIFGDLNVSGKLIINNLNSDTVDNLHSNSFLRSDADSTLVTGKKITLGAYGEIISGTQGPEIKSKSKILIHADTDGTNTNADAESIQIKAGNGSELGLQIFKTALKYNNTDVSLSNHSHNTYVPKSAILASGQDLNKLTTSGFYRINSGHPNSPSDWGQIIVCAAGGDTIGQIYLDYGQGNLFVRGGNPPDTGGVGQWSSWKKAALLDANNNLTMATKVYNAVYNDYAEWFEKEDLNETFEFGDIVSWNKTGIIKCKEANTRKVIGVVSDSYGHILGGDQLNNMEDNHKKYEPIGMAGRVSVKVIGKVEVGDLIVSSDIPGVGMVNNNPLPGTIIGKSIDENTNEKIKKIKIFIINS